MASPTVDKTSGKPRRKRRWFQFRLGTLLALVTLAGIVLGFVVNSAERQRRAVAFVATMGGRVQYEDDEPRGGNVSLASEWLRESLGKHYFRSVTGVSLYGGTRVSDAGLVHLKGLTGLQWLHLDETQVSDAGLVHLKGLTGLQRLGLGGTQVSGAGLVHLRGLTGLQRLYLQDTQVSDAGLVHLKGLTGLQRLRLQRTQVSDAGLVHLKALTGLEWLLLSNTQVSDAGLADLRASLPDCQINGP
jgi:hypothetical protein